MNGKITDRDLQILVFKYLCRVLKNRKIYHRFRCFIGNGERVLSVTRRPCIYYSSFRCMQPIVDVAFSQASENPFFSATTMDSVITAFEVILGKYDTIDEWDNGQVQSRITQLINTLIHCCVEKTVKDFRQLEDIGRETFDMVCKQIYGDDFVDETEKNIPEEVKKLIDAQREYLECNRMVDPRGLTGDPHFIEFLKKRGVIDENGRRRRPIRMMPPTLERLERPSNYSEWYHPTVEGLDDWELDEWEEI